MKLETMLYALAFFDQKIWKLKCLIYKCNVFQKHNFVFVF